MCERVFYIYSSSFLFFFYFFVSSLVFFGGSASIAVILFARWLTDWLADLLRYSTEVATVAAAAFTVVLLLHDRIVIVFIVGI